MNRPALWTPQEDAHLIVRYNAGVMAKMIGLEMGRTEDSVAQRLIRLRKKGAPLASYRLPRKRPAEIKTVKGVTQEDMEWMEHYRQKANWRNQIQSQLSERINGCSTMTLNNDC